MTAVARVSAQRVVAAGWRGVIIVSDDAGQTWRQAAVPVRTDLMALAFTSEQVGCAVGNDGVVLRTTDGGLNWTLVLDGHKAAELMLKTYEPLAEAEPDNTVWAEALREAKGYAAQAPSRPFLDVFFETESTGYVVGNFNLIFRTTDGGQTWAPQITQTDNPDGFNLYVGRRFGNTSLLAGELGLLRLKEEGSDTFRKAALPYEGSMFTAVATPSAWVLAGLRGNALRSTDLGRTWSPVGFGAARPATFVSAAVLDERSMVLVTAGNVYLSEDDGVSFKTVPVKAPMRYSSVVALDTQTVLLAGHNGVRRETLR